VAQLLAAGRAPRRPEVEQHDLAAQFAQGDLAAVDHLDGEIGGLGALPGQRRGGGFGRFVGGLFRCCCGFTLPFHLVGVPQCDADHCDQGQQDDEHPVVRFLTCHISEVLRS